MQIDRDEIVRLTGEYGGQWGLNHVRRLLNLIAIIGEDQEYDKDAVWTATHLHDWGAYAHWKRDGVHHAARSVEVIAPFLAERGCPEAFNSLVLECIELHHEYTAPKRIEAVLLSDADGLDFLGAVGVLRDISKHPRDLRKGRAASQQRRDTIPNQLVLPRSKEIARLRVQQMDALYEQFEENTFGCF